MGVKDKIKSVFSYLIALMIIVTPYLSGFWNLLPSTSITQKLIGVMTIVSVTIMMIVIIHLMKETEKQKKVLNQALDSLKQANITADKLLEAMKSLPDSNDSPRDKSTPYHQ